MKKNTAALLFLCLIALKSFSQSKSEELNDLLTSYNKLNTFNGSALVLYKGDILLNKGYGHKNIEDKTKAYSTNIYQIGSITKQFTATVILKLEKLKKINLNDPVSKYLPDFTNKDKVTAYHLLTHTSGIFNYTDDGEFMKNKLETPTTKSEMLQIINSNPLDFEPGSKMKYCNSGYLLLGYIIEALTQKKYETVVREMIFEPLQMTHSGFDFANLLNSQKSIGYDAIREGNGKKTIIVDSTVSFAGGAIYSTTDDLLKWHNALQNNKFLKKSIKDKLYTPYLNDFGMGWVTDKFLAKTSVFHNGSIPGFTSNIYRVIEDNTCVIILNNIANKNIDTITKNLLCILYDKPFKKPEIKEETKFTAASIQKYLGEYQFEGNFKMRIFLDNQRLFAQRIGEEDQFEMFQEKKDSFFLKAFEASLVFSCNNSDQVEKFCLIQSKKTMCATKIK